MSALPLPIEPPLGAVLTHRPGPESPKTLFRILRSAPCYFHQVIATALHKAGFEVRFVRKRANHHVWNASLLRGTVHPGTEVDAVQETISLTLRQCGLHSPKREVEVAVIGKTLGVAFIFPDGAPGTLVCQRGREDWCGGEWP